LIAIELVDVERALARSKGLVKQYFENLFLGVYCDETASFLPCR
jgi:hypothetical protein